MPSRLLLAPVLACSLLAGMGARPASPGGRPSIEPESLKEWLTYIASDELKGRQLHSEGLRLAAGYIAGHLRAWGVKPAGDRGTYYQRVTIAEPKGTRRTTVNVVGIIEGSDPRLKKTYVLFGAHYDHLGHSEDTPGSHGHASGDTAVSGCTGQSRDTPRAGDTINNGADDDGSGTVAAMAAARAFALGPRPKRSVLFVWHSGEESGLHGSRHMASHPVVPLTRIAAHLNMDMIGRNRCDDASQASTVYLVGSDRISTELHNVSEETNSSLADPLSLDYELNDPADPESFYTRSDHYSYASRGIPVIFYTTGMHRDYHYVTDEVGRIEFGKLTHIARLVYQTGFNVANMDHFPQRDRKGPRAGRGSRGKIGN